MAVLVIIIGFDIGDNNIPYTTKNKHPTRFTNLNLTTDFIKNDNNTVAMAK
ncbi:hypothetical protein [Seonamhaeicola algicola]|uniref:hypothetical protein n=1 Tax=Seonamhaeicola algicola TaxID=1719036 RepID=UPI00164C099C|nr:hypothetical protein [Seonamhaeicola algicola]